MDPPTRVSLRTTKGQSRKRALSNTSPPPLQASTKPSKKVSKEAQRRPAKATPPPPSAIVIRSSPLPATQPERGEDEDEEDVDVDIQDEDEDQTPPPPAPVEFMSRWKAVAGKETLTGAQSQKLSTETIFYHSIEAWRDSIIRRCLPRKFTVNRLEAAVSYEKQSKADIFLHEINERTDLYKACELIYNLRQQHPTKPLSLDLTLYLTEERPIQETPAPSLAPASQLRSGRRTATQIQEANLPNILAVEEASGNRIPAVASKWSCVNVHCRNKAGICWQNRRGSETDRAEHHYPVSSNILQRWSREIQTEESTVEQPSQNIVCQLSAWKMRQHQPKDKEPEPKDNSLSDQFKELIQLVTIRELQAMRRDQQ